MKLVFKVACIYIFGNLASSTLSFMMSFSILSKTESSVSYGNFLMISSLVSIVMIPYVGKMIDQYARKKLLIMAQMISSIALLFFALSHQDNLVALCLLSVVLTLCDMVFSACLLSSIALLTDDDLIRQRLNALGMMTATLFGLVAPVLAGWLLQLITISDFVWLELCCELAVIAVIMTLTIKQNQAQVDGAATGSSVTFKSVIEFMKGEPVLTGLCVMMAVLNFATSGLTVGLPTLVQEVTGGNTLLMGLIELGLPFGMMLASVNFLTIKHTGGLSTVYRAYLGIAVLFICEGGLALVNDHVPLSLLVGGMLLMGMVLGWFTATSRVPLLTFLQSRVPSAIQGRVFSLIDFVVRVTQPLGLFAYGMLMANHQVGLNLCITGGCLLLLIAGLQKNSQPLDS